jgi:trk system potassium uptake protein TrkH
MIRTIIYLLAGINLFVCTMMILPLAAALVYHEPQWRIFLTTLAGSVAVSAVPLLIVRRGTIKVTHRAGLGAVGLAWFITPLFAAVPFIWSGEIGSFTDCYFESVSGFTTTGASILQKIEGISHAVLFWRSFIQWMGGMGIVLVTVAFFSFLGAGAMELYKAEVPGFKDEKLYPRIATVARTLWITYIVITVLQVVLLRAGGMNLFDSLCHAFTTMATGGFSTKTTSIAFWPSPYIQWVIIAFMAIAGTNFSLHATICSHKGLAYLKDTEFLAYVGIFLLSITLIGVARALTCSVGNVEQFIRDNSFQVVSIMTTTGFSNTDYEKWHEFTQFPPVLLVALMFIGGMQGSTGGGIKVARILVLFKILIREIRLLIHPRSVHQVKLRGRVIPEETIKRTAAFFFMYVIVYVLSSLALALTGVDAVTSLTGVAACMNNIGPGFGLVGPADNYSILPVDAKWVLVFDMIAGRLEVYTVVIMFFPMFWKK